MNKIEDLKRKITKMINICDVSEDTYIHVLRHLGDDLYYLQEMYDFLVNNVFDRDVTQTEIYEFEMDLTDPSWRYTEVVIEDDDGTIYTQEEWKRKLKEEKGE